MSALHPKNAALKQRLLEADYWLCMERARHYTDVYRQTEGEHPALRAAMGLERTLEQMTIRIEPEELLVGNRASRPVAPPFAPERGDFNFVFAHLFEPLKAFGYRISDEHQRWLFDEILPYWRGKTVRDLKTAALEAHGLSSRLSLTPRELKRKWQMFGPRVLLRLFLEEDPERSRVKTAAEVARFALRLPQWLSALKAASADNLKGRGRCTDVQAHFVLGHQNVLQLGFGGIAERARQRLASASAGERGFLEAVQRCCGAVRDFSHRFAALARQQAASVGPERRAELLAIAERCARVPWEPARDFHDAVQAMWFAQNAAIISYGAGSGITPGRVDQLLRPYFERGLDDGSLTREQALRLAEELIIKLNDNVIIWPNLGGVRLNPLGSDVQNVTLGGVDERGEDATHALTDVFVEAIENTNLATTASFRISQKSPPGWVERVIRIHAKTNSPALLCDETAIAALVRDGYPLEAARQYCLVGCVEPSGNGDTFGATGGSKVYFPSALDLLLHRGHSAFFGTQDGPDTGEPAGFATFESFLEAYFTQLEHLVGCVTQATGLRDRIWAERFPNPLISSTLDGCVERAADMTAGGARYNFGSVGGAGLGTVVDSLAAIRQHVYRDRVVTLAQLVRAIDRDFRGDEELLARLKHGPRFGNDDDEVDGLAATVVERFCAMVSSRQTSFGGHYKASLISYGLNVFEGALEPATPDGRRAGAPVSNSMSPSNGAEKKGPTAALNSLAKIDQTKIGFGNSVNLKFPLGLLGSPKGTASVAGLVKTYFKKGGFHVQLNAVDRETLLRAQQKPDDYADLIVRVSGYSAYFTRLGRQIQDDIIARTEFQSC